MRQLGFSVFTESSLAANAASSAFQTCVCAPRLAPPRQIGFSPVKSEPAGRKRRRQASIYAAIFHLFMTQVDHSRLPAASAAALDRRSRPAH